MTPQSTSQYPAIDAFQNDIILAEFLHEMDEFDLQTTQIQALNTVTEPEFQKTRTTPPPPPATPTPRKKRSTSWLRRKQELNSLRSESEALETQLAFMLMERDRHIAYQHSVLTIPEDQGMMWQSVAEIARQECQSAQEENARLKNDMQLYVRACEMLQTQIVAAEARHQQLLRSSLAFDDGFRVGMIRTRVLSFDNDDVLDKLERRINARFHELGWIICEAQRPIQGGTATEQVQICRKNGYDSAAAVEFRHFRLLPFGEDTMAKTVWEIFELGGVVTKTNTRVVRITSDMVSLVSRHTVPFGNNASVSADVHTVIKRFAVSTGMIALIESHSEWTIRYPASEVLRSTTEEGGWVVVHEYPMTACSSIDGATQRTSQLKTSVKLRPNEGGNVNSLTSTIVDVVIPSFRDILSSHHQNVENFLLDSKRTVRA